MITNIRTRAKALEEKRAEGSLELENALSAITALNIDVEKDHGVQTLIETGEVLDTTSRIALQQVASYNFIKKELPRSKRNIKINDLVRLDKEFDGFIKNLKKTTEIRLSDSLAKIGFHSQTDLVLQTSWLRGLSWSLVFRCLRLSGYEDAWEVLAFNPKDFLEWWRNDSEQRNEESSTWDDISNLARKLFYAKTLIDSNGIRSLRLHGLINEQGNSAKVIVLGLVYMINNSTWAKSDISLIFEIATPVIYVVCDIIATTHRLANSPFRDEKAFIDKLENQVIITGALLKKIESFRVSLASRLSKSFSVEGATNFSAADIARLCEPILVGDDVQLVRDNTEMEAYVVKARQDEKKMVDDVESSDDCYLVPSTPRFHCDVSFLKNLGLEYISVSEEEHGWIGEGSYGTVRMMKLKGSSGWCAVKIPVARLGAANRVEREAEIWHKIEHRNVLPLLGYTVIERYSLPSLVSPLCEDNLERYLRQWHKNPDNFLDKSSGLSEKERFQFLEDVVNGLSHIHYLGIAHGDLRAANILVRKEETSDEFYAVLADFGVSDSEEDVQVRVKNRTTEGQKTNDAWLSPELLQTRPRADNLARVSQKGDIWAFGCVMLEVQYGTVPFEKSLSPHSDIIVHQALPAAKEDIIGLREPHWELMLRCWDYNESSRIQIATLNVTVSHLLQCL